MVALNLLFWADLLICSATYGHGGRKVSVLGVLSFSLYPVTVCEFR